MDGLKIALVRMRYTPYGGAEVFLSRLIDQLIERGHECHVFANRWDATAKERLVFHKVGVIKTPSFLRVWSFAMNAYRLIEDFPADVIMGLDKTLYQDIYRAGDGCHREWLRRRRSIQSPVKNLLMALNPLHLTILSIEKRLFSNKRLKLVITNSVRCKDEIIKHYGLPPEIIRVIYNGIDVKGLESRKKEGLRDLYREVLGISEKEIAILFVGSGFERKGLGFLIQALNVLRKSGVDNLKLIVVGKGRIKRYKRLAQRLNLVDRVVFTGPVEDVMGYYSAGDIFVLPSIYEPFSNACLEAMASWLPVVTSRTNGVSEVITGEKDGMIIDDPTDPHEIAKRIMPLLDTRKRLEMGSASRLTAGRFTIERCVDEIVSLITEMEDAGLHQTKV